MDKLLEVRGLCDEICFLFYVSILILMDKLLEATMKTTEPLTQTGFNPYFDG